MWEVGEMGEKNVGGGRKGVKKSGMWEAWNALKTKWEVGEQYHK